ncbi:unnamed protein product [Mytilus coruscus]|uniref:Uncharacterized protein n=1 Tax=Mytilus coruscus TaxID=42192 RepID=A0A6J8EBR1_MYTCO|nr:unnamed protein product [Mytilus coruscus]
MKGKSEKTIEFYFDTTDKKLEFEKKFESAKKLLHLKTNTELFNRLIELLDLNQKTSMSTETSEDKSVDKNEILSDDSFTFLKSESTLDIDPNETFVCTYSQIQELLKFHETFRNLKIMNYEKCGHVARMTLLSQDLYQRYLFWSCSPNLHGDYYINHKMFHSYMCSGILNIQRFFGNWHSKQALSKQNCWNIW